MPFFLNFDRNFTFYLNFDYNTRFEIQADLSQKACIWSLILELSPVSKDEWNQKCSISLKLLFPLIKSKYLKCLPRISYFAQIIIFLLYFFPLFAHYFWTKANEGFSWHYSRIYCSVKTSFPFKKGFTFRSCDDINVKGIFDARLDILPWLDNVVTVPCKKVLSLTVQDFLRSPHKSLKVPLPLSKDLTSHFVFFN